MADRPKTIADAPDPTYPFIPSTRKKGIDLSGIELPDVEITIQGRTFRTPKRTTIAQDLYARKMLKAANLDTFVQRIDLKTYEMDEFAEEIILRAYDTGVLFQMLSALLAEDGVKWTEEWAGSAAQFFADVEEEDDKAKLFQPIAGLVLSFFINAVASFENGEPVSISPISQDAPEATATSIDANGVRATTPSETGRPSSTNSPISTPISLGDS